MGARPPSAPCPPLPPFPRSPPLHIAREPTLRGKCASVARPVDSRSAVVYPGYKWRMFSEWDGLDEEAQEQARYSYMSYGDTSGYSYSGRYGAPT
jgi:hypothetical protein